MDLFKLLKHIAYRISCIVWLFFLNVWISSQHYLFYIIFWGYNSDLLRIMEKFTINPGLHLNFADIILCVCMVCVENFFVFFIKITGNCKDPIKVSKMSLKRLSISVKCLLTIKILLNISMNNTGEVMNRILKYNTGMKHLKYSWMNSYIQFLMKLTNINLFVNNDG